MKEIWKDIIGFEGIYEISNLGRIRRIKTGRILSTRRSDDWYITVTLYKDKKRYGKSLHRLVSEAFISNPDNLPEVNHRDEDKTNNRVDNLEFCDHKYNVNYGTIKDRIRNTRLKNGHINEEYSGLDKKSYGKKYYQEHKEERKEYGKKYYQDCKEEMKKYKETHKEEIKEYGKKYREEHKEYFKKYREEHREERKEYGKKYYQDHKVKK